MKSYAVALAVALVAAPLALPGTAQASGPAPYTNCTVFHVRYPHGVGKAGAHDRTSGRPVTTFLVSTKIYNAAMRANGDLDRDGDGIACEKH